jgi:hypothetical protein
MQFHRYLSAEGFTKELNKLHAYRSSVNTRLLETLEAERMLSPRLRLRYPDAVARRFWLHDHEHWGPRQMVHAVEPDGVTWDAAVDLHNALHRWNNALAYGLTVNPIDELEPRFAQFVQVPSATTLEAWENMAICVEHIATALGATALQLDMKFKQLWRDPDIQRLLKRNDVAEVARKPSLLQNWPALKADFDKLRMEPGGKIAAELAMAYRIRGGVHQMLPENDHLELESLFTGLMCAAVLTFVEVRNKAAPSLPSIGVAPPSVPQSEIAGP